MSTWTTRKITTFFEGTADPALTARFAAYHFANEDVYDEFVRRARMAQHKGLAHYSQWTIIQAIRWDKDMATTGKPFKINNDHIAFYARMADAEHPTLKGFFELRAMKPRDRRMSSEERAR